MAVNTKALPDDIDTLKKLFLETVSDLRKTIEQKDLTIQKLAEQVALLERFRFAQRSEKVTPEDKNQQYLFNDIEEGCIPEDPVKEEPVPQPRKKGNRNAGRKPLPSDIPREEVIHDLPDAEKTCPCCGKARPELEDLVSEELDFIPAKIKVIRNIRKRYGSCGCDGFQSQEEIPGVVTAPGPARLIPGGIVTPSLAAHVVVSKFCDALPFYRQSRIFTRFGVELSRQTLCNWSMTAARKCEPLLEKLRELIRGGPLINMDETTVQVLHEPGRAAETKSYMWVMAGRAPEPKAPVPGERKIVLFHYSQTRNSSIPEKLLGNFRGVLQSDGYAGYNAASSKEGIIHIGCLAHVRRKFFDAGKVMKGNDKGLAFDALRFIERIYAEENSLKMMNLPDADLLAERQTRVSPVLKEFEEWLYRRKGSVPPSLTLGQAVSYAIDQFPLIYRYLDHPLATPDNNAAENAIRPFVIGRKNWLFSNTPRGAHASAALYSLIETAKANGKEPMEYMHYLFSRLPKVRFESEWESLLPWDMED